MDQEQVPEWLLALLNADFLKRKGKNEDDLKHVCLDCASKSLTESEKKENHHGHLVLEAIGISRFYGYATTDILRLKDRGLDVSGVTAFSINSGSIYYPKSRKGYKCYVDKYGVANFCYTCGWRLTKPGTYCSILCKLMFMARDYPHKSTVLIQSAMMFQLDQVSKVDLKENKCKKTEIYMDKNQMVLGDKLKDMNIAEEENKCKKTEINIDHNQVVLRDKLKDKSIDEDIRSSLKFKVKLVVKDRGIKKQETFDKGKKLDCIITCSETIKQNQEFRGKKISGLKKLDMMEQQKQHKKMMKKKRAENKNKSITPSETHVGVDGGAGINKAEDNDEKLQCFICVAVDNDDNMLSLKKKRRKGLPRRAPMF